MPKSPISRAALLRSSRACVVASGKNAPDAYPTPRQVCNAYKRALIYEERSAHEAAKVIIGASSAQTVQKYQQLLERI